MRIVERNSVLLNISKRYHPARVFDKPFGGRECQLVFAPTHPEDVREVRDTLSREYPCFDVIVRNDNAILFSIKRTV